MPDIGGWNIGTYIGRTYGTPVKDPGGTCCEKEDQKPFHGIPFIRTTHPVSSELLFLQAIKKRKFVLESDSLHHPKL
jgi:hypothetical protein